MHVTFITTSFPQHETDVSGTFVYRLGRELARTDLTVTVIAPGTPTGKGREVLEGIEVVRPSYAWPRSRQRLCYGYGIPQNLRRHPQLILQAVPLAFSLGKEAIRRAGDTDVFHAHWTFAGLVAVIAGRLTRTPVVITVWGSDVRALPRPLNRWILRRARTVIGLSAEMRSLAEELGVETISIPAPIDRERFSEKADGKGFRLEVGIPAAAPLALFVGRLSEEKDPLTFVRSIGVASRTQPDICGAILGDGPLRALVERVIADLGLQDRVFLLGARHDVERALAAADVAVALSPIENVWSTTIAESSAVGVPVVLTAAGHTQEVFTDEQDALLVAPRSPDAVAEAILRVLTNPEQKARLVEGSSALHKRNGFDTDSIIHRHLEIYHDAIS
jgi:glycosyltransferase involved in cell wall biosynthesis